MQKQYHFSVTVDGEKINLVSERWNPMECFSHLPKIGKAFAVPISMLLPDKESSENLNTNITEALFLLFENMQHEDAWALFQLITKDVFINNGTRRIDLNEDFGYDLGAVLSVVAETLSGNYGSLFTKGGLSSLFQQMAGLTVAAQQ